MLRVGLFGRSLATVALVGALSFAMPIAASGLENPVPLGEFVIGAVRAAAPAEAAASVVGPEGTLIVSGVVALGALAYATQDTWMPWVAGLFGAGGGASTGVGARVVLSWSNIVAGSLGTSIDVQWASTDDTWGAIEVDYVCKDGAGNVSSGRLASDHMTDIGGGYPAHAGSSGVKHLGNCPITSTLVSARAGDYSVDASNILTWAQPFNPNTGATYQVNVTCRKADGSSAVITATTTAPGVASATANGLLVPSCAAQWNGAHGEGMAVTGARTGSPQAPLSSQTFPTVSTLYPNCVGAGVACTYVVTYLGAPCVVGQVECVAWSRRAQLAPQDYGCLFGPYVMTLARCGIDERVYEPNGVVLTKLNTDGNPNTYDAPVPAWAPAPAADPLPGAPGGAPVPVSPDPWGTPTPTPTSNSDCWPSGSAMWNPVDWVLIPVKCAMTWAFVPSTATLTGPISDFKGAWTSKPPGSLITGATTVFASIGNGWDGGCSGSASASFSQPGLGHPLRLPCTPTGGGSGSVAYTAMQIALIVATLIYVWHMVAAGISAQATGSGGD